LTPKKRLLPNGFAGKTPLGKKVIFPAPHLPKTFSGIAFISNDKSNSNFFYQISTFISPQTECLNKGINTLENLVK